MPANEVPTLDKSMATSDPQMGRVLYTCQADGEGEITVEEGTDMVVVEPDGKQI